MSFYRTRFDRKFTDSRFSGPSASFAGPLDAFTADLAGSWSVARRLLSSYTGALLRVRRSSDNTEQDIGFTADGSLDTAALLSFCGANSGFVRTVYDQSGNARNFGQSTAANQPRIVNAGVVEVNLGKPALEGIVANNTGLTCASFTARAWIASARLIANFPYSGLVTGATTNIILVAEADASSLFPPSVANYAYYVNKVDETADLTPFCLSTTRVMSVTSNAATEAWQWGAERNNAGRSFAGYMQELAIYSAIPTFRSNVEQAMMDFLGL
jgi:hypothetical protein